VCLAVAGCAAAPPSPSPDTGVDTDPAVDSPVAVDPADTSWLAPDPDALAAWERFPAGARPRPIVISTPPKLPDGGFADADAKEAALAGRYQLAAALPANPSATLRVTLPDGPVELPSITAQDAVDALSALQIEPSGDTLPITRIELGTVTFDSDRGPLPLPAWLFTVGGAKGPIAWPAIADSAFWPREPTELVKSGGALLGADARTVKLVLPAPPKEGCPGDPRNRYEPAVLESASAVVVGLRAVPDGVVPGTPVADCAVPSVGRSAEYSVALASPLGGRVLLAPIGVGYTEVLAVAPV
jgi:hypothetical protein